MTEKPKGRAGKRTPPPLATLRKKKVILFGWYGGKFSHLDWLLPRLPKCHHYCEPFAGSAAVLLNRLPSPVETYNDLDGEVVNFFRVCRDQGLELTRLMALTPLRGKSSPWPAPSIPIFLRWRGRGASTFAPARFARGWPRRQRWVAGATAKTPAARA